MTNATEREPLVERIQQLTGATRFDAIKGVPDPNAPGVSAGQLGCRDSHYAVYRMVPLGEDLLIFEDDCEVIDPSFMDLLSMKNQYDIMYFGLLKTFYVDTPIKSWGFRVNTRKRINSWGCHAMWISPRALDIIRRHKAKTFHADHIWNEIENEYNLRVWRPTPVDRYVRQQAGLISYITGKARK